MTTGEVKKAKTKYMCKKRPSKQEMEALEAELRLEFNNDMMNLVSLYGLAEHMGINDLCNKAIDNIQDGYNEFGSVFGPGLAEIVFEKTKEDSKLRELCVGSMVMWVSDILRHLNEYVTDTWASLIGDALTSRERCIHVSRLPALDIIAL